MNTSQELDKLGTALSKFQSEMVSVKQDKVNPFFKSSYADLSSIWGAIRPHLAANGLSVVQDAITLPDGASVCTRVIHSSGQWIEFGPLIIPQGKRDPHTTGSSISYGKRYGLCAALGIVSDNEDDDGNRAATSIKEQPKAPPQPVINCDIDEFYLIKESKFDGIELRAYVEECAIKKGITEQEIINILGRMIPKKFDESFERWKGQQK